MFRYILFIVLSLFVSSVFAQKFSYKVIPNSIQNKIESSALNFSEFTDLTSYLPDNFVKDGTVDYTSYIQKGLLENRNILMPNFPVLINDNGLEVYDNSILYFQEYSEVLLKSSKKPKYQIFKIHDKNNVAVHFPRIKGDRDHHIGDKGEWGMGISILGSKNIEIINPFISNCWGDGIYVGHSKETSRNIKIKGGVIDNNLRNGISITSAKNLLVQNVLISNTNGKNPQTGIDIEPNSPSNEINNITLNNVTTFNNFNNGLLIHLDKLPGKLKKDANIKINGLKDISSGRGIRVSGTYKRDKTTNKPLTGAIHLENVDVKDSQNPSVFNKNKFFPSIKIKNFKD